jgi:cobalt-zinc-cadmium efflux system protein
MTSRSTTSNRAGLRGARSTGEATSVSRLGAALGLILAFMAGELAVGLASHSLAILSDAAHMVTDAAALGLAIFAARLAVQPPRGGLTYGMRRAEILSALANGVALVTLAGFIVVESIVRLVNPVRVAGAPLLYIALIGIAVNVVTAWLVAGANRRSLNVEGAFRHILTDLFAFAGTAAAGVVILVSGFLRADSIASLLIAALMLATSWDLIRRAGRTLLEAAPHGVVPADVGNALAAHPHVASLHDLHIWEVTSGFPALSAHVLVHPGDDCHAIRIDLERLLGERYGIEHTTLQVDHVNEGTVRWVDAVSRKASPGS